MSLQRVLGYKDLTGEALSWGLLVQLMGWQGAPRIGTLVCILLPNWRWQLPGQEHTSIMCSGVGLWLLSVMQSFKRPFTWAGDRPVCSMNSLGPII